ncbi:MAG: class I SAM-dependent methyltransferase [Isosphaeraceae bacterium]
MIGTLGDLGGRTLAELDDLHYECEVHYRARILAPGAGERERPTLFAEAYESLAMILGERRRRTGATMGTLGLPGDAAAQISERIGTKPGRVLDVGCGTGVLVQQLIARGHEARGIDVSPRLVEVGRERINRELGTGPDETLICGDFLRCELGDGDPFDLVYTNDVLEHIHPDEAPAFVRRAFTRLRPGGWLWLVTPNRWTGPGDATILRHPIGTPSRGLHLKEYTLGELHGLIDQAGFTEIGARLWNSGRLRRATRFRPAFTWIKRTIEPVLAAVPARVRRRVMWALDYATVVARRPVDGGSMGNRRGGLL